MPRRNEEFSPTITTAITTAVVFMVLSGQASSLGQEPATTLTTKVSLLPPSDASLASQKAWVSVADPFDPNLLDSFIASFPNSAEARRAFSLRYGLVKASQSIDAYNLFLQRYPTRALSPLAITEVYNLYSQQDTMSAYLDFMKRYPGTTEAQLALKHVQSIAFDLVSSTKSIQECDTFLRRFPEAPQFEAIKNMAREWMLREEQDRRASIVQQYGTNSPQCKDALRERVNILMQNVNANIEKRIDAQGPIEKRVLTCATVRTLDVLSTVYGPESASKVAELLEAESTREEIVGVSKQLSENQRELVAVLKNEFKKTRDTLRKGFTDVCQGQAAILDSVNANFDTLDVSVSKLHDDLSEIHADLVAVNSNLRTLDEDLAKVHDSLVTLITVTSAGFDRLETGLNTLITDTIAGFNQVSMNQQVQTSVLNQVSMNQQVQTSLLISQLQAILQEGQLTRDQLANMTTENRAGLFDYIMGGLATVRKDVGDTLDRLGLGKVANDAQPLLDRVLCPASTFIPDEGKLLGGILRRRFGDNELKSVAIEALDPSVLIPELRKLPNLGPRIDPLVQDLLPRIWTQRRDKVVGVIKMFPTSKLSPETLNMQVRGPDELRSFTNKAAAEAKKPVELVEKACKIF